MESTINAIFEHVFAQLPTTALGWAAHLAVGLVFCLTYLTFFEWYVHKNMMHVKGLPKVLYTLLPTLHRVQNRHAVMHHNTFYKQFDYEPDPEGVDENINIRFYQTLALGSATVPLMILLGYFSPVVLVMYWLSGYAHNKTWNIVHTQMHKPRDVWFRNTRYYRAVAYHHFLHHHFQNKHYNVVVPFADFVLGSTAKPRIGDVREMVRLGYLRPRSERGKRLQPKMKPNPRYTFVHDEKVPAPQLRVAA